MYSLINQLTLITGIVEGRVYKKPVDCCCEHNVRGYKNRINSGMPVKGARKTLIPVLRGYGTSDMSNVYIHYCEQSRH